MKKRLGILFFLWFLGETLVFNFFNVNAKILESSFFEPKLIALSDGASETVTEIKTGINKVEKISCFKYVYKSALAQHGYQYILVRAEVSFSENDGKLLASAYFDSIFRYNEYLKTSKCLSTSHGQRCYSDRYSLQTSCRTKNLAMDMGESFGKVGFYDKLRSVDDVSKFIFSCDEHGNIYKRMI